MRQMTQVSIRPDAASTVLRRTCECGGHDTCACEADRRQPYPSRLGISVGPSDDPYEREADLVADHVVNALEHGALTVLAEGAAGLTDAASSVQRQVCSVADVTVPLGPEDVDEEEQRTGSTTVMAKVQSGAPLPPLQTAPQKLGFRASSPLPEPVASRFGAVMGADFSDVRIHRNDEAARSCDALGARAFALDRDIAFNRGEFDPGSTSGIRLLAHELAHTLQQRTGAVRRLAISRVGQLQKRTCGGYGVRWLFELGAPAPSDGYIVQKIDEYKEVVDCPRTARCLASPTLTFWEAWSVKRGQTREELHSQFGFTDSDVQPSAPTKGGYNVGTGDVRFYRASVTGDLGKDGTAPARPNGGWGPGAVSMSGSLPSTPTRPSWWGTAPTEGPARRSANAAWHCCGGASDFNDIHATP